MLIFTFYFYAVRETADYFTHNKRMRLQNNMNKHETGNVCKKQRYKRTQNLLIRRQEKTGRAGIKPCLPAAYNN